MIYQREGCPLTPKAKGLLLAVYPLGQVTELYNFAICSLKTTEEGLFCHSVFA